jgi:Protein of unknown function (DUF2829)
MGEKKLEPTEVLELVREDMENLLEEYRFLPVNNELLTAMDYAIKVILVQKLPPEWRNRIKGKTRASGNTLLIDWTMEEETEEDRNELVKAYLDQMEKVRGVYILKGDDYITDQRIKRLGELWILKNMKEPLVVLDKDEDFYWTDSFGFEVAVQLLKRGYCVSRRRWEDMYLEMKEGKIKGYALWDKNELVANYVANSEDILAEDWYQVQT